MSEKKPRRAALVLTPETRAVFSKSGATQGEHQTLPAPPGSALLGWAARAYGAFEAKNAAQHVFHSGNVRFSDAFPVNNSGEIGWPTPQCLLKQKDIGKAFDENGRLDCKQVRVGPAAFARSFGDTAQAEPQRGAYVTPGGCRLEPTLGGRLRTATKDGRAKEQSLFGYSHIEPDGMLRYVAQIDADEMEDEVWELLLNQFRESALMLGRASRTGYGGRYLCEVVDDLSIWPESNDVRAVSAGSVFRVLILSPLALIDEWGAPNLNPQPRHLGLPIGGKLNPRESAVSVRRFAPWNAKLERRDVERHVIDAGSVLAFDLRLGECPAGKIGWAGAWTETGLGLFWADPPILRPDGDGAPTLTDTPIKGLERHPASAAEPQESELTAWAARQAMISDPARRENALSQLLRELKSARPAQGPSPSQWQSVANAIQRASNAEFLSDILFDGDDPVTGRAESNTRDHDWNDGKPKIRTVLREAIKRMEKEGSDHAALSRWEIAWVISEVARHVQSERQDETDLVE
jgi:CRISPR-associated protein Csx10